MLMRVIVNLFQQLLDAEHLEDELISGELLEDVSLPEGGDHGAVEAFPRDVLQALTIGALGQIGLSWYLVYMLVWTFFVCCLFCEPVYFFSPISLF